jgi:hypothetical protein
MKPQPAAAHSAFYWRGQPSAIGTLVSPSRKDRSALGTARRYSPVPENQAAGQKSADKRAKLRRGGL